MKMVSFTAYVAGPVLRPGHISSSSIGSLYAELEKTARAHGVRITLPTYSDQLDGLTAPAFAKEIRDRIHKADATIAVLVRPTSRDDLSVCSIAMEAQEAALAGKPIAILMEDANLALPRLLAGLNRVQQYSFAGSETLNLMFDKLGRDIGPRAR
jgi:hypothetical protein